MNFEKPVEDAVAWLASDGFIAYPTETVWGLGACADRSSAIERLLCWKRRSSDAPLAVLVPSTDAAIEFECQMDGFAKRLAEAYWPGPLTLVVPCRRQFARRVARGDGALGLRCSSHPIARALALAVREAGLAPLTSTSLNRSGESPAVNFASASAMIRGGSDGDLGSPFLVDAPGVDWPDTAASGAEPSSVVDCTRPLPEILRVGAIARESLEAFWTEPAAHERRD